MFTGACGLSEKLSLTLVPRSNVPRMILKLAYKENTFSTKNHCQLFLSFVFQLVGSAPNFPHGMIDPIEEIAKVSVLC